MPIGTQHGFEALRLRLKELWTKVAPEIPGAQDGGPVDRTFNSLQDIRTLVNDLEARVIELERARPF